MALITVSGHLFDPSGAATAGSVTFQLTNYGASIPRVIGTNSVVATNISFVANNSGFWTGSIQGNDTIDPGATQSPPTTFYEVSFKDVSGNTIATLPFQFTGAGPANLDSQGPMNAAPQPFVPPNNAALLGSNQTFTGNNTFQGTTTLGPIAGNPQFGRINNGIYYVSTTGVYQTIQSAVNDAQAAGGGIVMVPAGTWSTTGTTVAITGVNIVIQGSGEANTVISSSSTSLPVITIAAGSSNFQIRDCTVSHSVGVTAGSGAHGISFSLSNFCSRVTLERLVVSGNDVGILCGPTDYAEIRHTICEQNQNDGIQMSNSASVGGLQWFLEDILCQKNGRNGVFVNTVNGPVNNNMAEWHNVNTFANSSDGINIQGTAGTPVNDVRISECFLGQDGNSELLLNTFGVQHVIKDVVTELAGTTATGPTLGTAASNVGHGFQISSNNTDVTLIGGAAYGHSYSGILAAATEMVIVGFTALNNGGAASAGHSTQSGVYIQNGSRVSITGGRSGNTGAGTSQKWGVWTEIDAVTCVGMRLDNNATAAAGGTPSLKLSRFLTGDVADTVIAANIVPSTGWGTGNSVSAVSGTKERFSFTINSGTGPTASPSIVITFPVAWASTPYIIAKNTNTTGAATQTIVGENSVTTTGVTLTWLGTPTPSSVYTFTVLGI